jgi:fatty-acyl-CoA synthase
VRPCGGQGGAGILTPVAMPASRTVPGLLDEMAGRHPDRAFLIDGGRRWTWAGFRDAARAVAKGLHALGLRGGDRVAILMGNQAEWPLTQFAAATLGATAVAVNTWWRAGELAHALALSEASVLVMAERYLRHDYAAELASLGDLGEALPALRHIVCVDAAGPPGALPFAALLARGEAVPDAAIDAAREAVRPDDTALICFTSGSTARAKAVPLLHDGLIRNMHGIGERMRLTADDRLLLAVSLFWAFACVNAVFALATHGGTIVLQRHFDPAETLALIERERCTLIYAMANMAMALHAHPDRHRRDLSSLRTGLTMPDAVPAMVELGAREVTTCYGLTECYGNSTVADCRAPLALRRRSAGPALPGTEVQIVDPATRRPLAQGEVGEVRLRGFVTPGYLKDPARTAEAIDAEGWFHTGDIALLDAEGNLHFRGRIKEMIKTGGINVSPVEVEALLLSHPAVHQAVVVGVPDAAREEIVAALVVPKPGAAVTAEALIRHCRDAAAAYKVPRLVEIVAAGEVPLTDTGKVSKRMVQERFAAARRDGGGGTRGAAA